MLYANKTIEQMEEITFDYGHTWSRYNPRCYCGSENCTGHLAKQLRKVLRATKKAKDLTTTKRIIRAPKKDKNDPNYAG
jgi:hypothetical protein